MVVDANHPAVPGGLPEGPPSGRLTLDPNADKANAPWHGHPAWGPQGLARESQDRPGPAVANSHGRDAHATPQYDQAGSNVRGPRPADPNANNAAHFRYDAWNRENGDWLRRCLAVPVPFFAAGDHDRGAHRRDIESAQRLEKGYRHLCGRKHAASEPVPFFGSAPGTLDANDTLLATYRYDGLNRRVMKAVAVDGNSVTDYMYHNEDWQIVEVRRGVNQTPTAAAYKQFVYDIRYIDAPVCRWWDKDSDGTMEPAAGEMQYFTNDGNFNTTALVDANSGGVVERYLYDPYGRVTVLNGAAGAEKDPNVAEWSPDADNKSDWDNEILFCGYRYDPETGNYIARRRYLTPPLGRWITREPLLGNTPGSGYHDGVNVYQYVVGSPTQRLDPQGLRSLTWIPCSGKTLVVMTDYCCYEDQRKIEKAVCGAYTALVATNAALWNHQNTRPWTTENSFTHHRVLDYFHDGQEYDDKGGGNLGEDISADAKMRGLVNRVRGVTYALEDRLDDSSGTLYQCDGKKGACATARAWVRPYSGYAVHICHLFLHGSEDSPNWLRAKTIIHELSHLYEQTTDSGTYGPWQSGGMGGDTATYIRGENEAGIPQYYNPRKRLSTWPDGQPRVDGPGHADTIAEFVMNWYK